VSLHKRQKVSKPTKSVSGFAYMITFFIQGFNELRKCKIKRRQA